MSSKTASVRVIASSTTFYPPTCDGKEQTSNMVLKTVIERMRDLHGGELEFLTAGDLHVVLHEWRSFQLLFVMMSKKQERREIMRMQLQKIRELLIFLFGRNLNSIVKWNISQNHRRVFAQYVDKYVEVCHDDYVSLISALRFDRTQSGLERLFMDAAADLVAERHINVLTCVLFKNHKIVARFCPAGSCVTFEPETYEILSLFEEIHYDMNDVTSSGCFDPHFVSAENNPGFQNKGGFLRVNRTPVSCVISSTQCSPQSPYVVIVVTQDVKLPQVVEFVSKVTEAMLDVPPPVPVFEARDIADDLLHYIVINRMSGDVWELPKPSCVRLFMERCGLQEDEATREASVVQKNMAIHGISAMVRGFTMAMRGELGYQFCYEMRFENKDGELLKPASVFTPPAFTDDNGISYGLIADTFFRSESGVSCIELFSVYRGKIQVKDVISANDALYSAYKRMKTKGKSHHKL